MQLLFLLHFQVSKYTTMVSYFGSMGYCFANYWYFFEESSNFSLPSYHKIPYSANSYQVSMLVTVAIVIVPLVVWSITKIVHLFSD